MTVFNDTRYIRLQLLPFCCIVCHDFHCVCVNIHIIKQTHDMIQYEVQHMYTAQVQSYGYTYCLCGIILE